MLLLKILIFVLVLIDVDFQMLRRLANDDLAFEILFWTSDVESPSIVILLPKYTNSSVSCISELLSLMALFVVVLIFITLVFEVLMLRPICLPKDARSSVFPWMS